MRAEPTPVRRYALTALLALAGVLVVLLLVRPLIASFADEADDAALPVATTAEAAGGPLLVELVLNNRHGLPGETVDGDHARLLVVVAPDLATGYSVVDAWSPVNECPLSLGADRLVDCAGATWTYGGIAIDPANPNLVRFPAQDAGATVVADFTRVVDLGG
jgi:hypothetical protein